MNRENPYILQYGEYGRILKLARKKPSLFRDLVVHKFTQATSHKVPYIETILNALDRCGSLNTSNVRSMTGLSWNSVNSTLELFREINIVNVKTHHDRKNNEKIYSLKRDRAIFYLIWLQYRKNSFPFVEGSKQNLQIDEFFSKQYPLELLDHEINLSAEQQKVLHIRVPRIKISKLPYLYARDLLIQFSKGLFCYKCFEKGDVSTLTRAEDYQICNRCKDETEYAEEYPIRNHASKRKWDIDSEVSNVIRGTNPLKAMKKTIVRNKNRN